MGGVGRHFIFDMVAISTGFDRSVTTVGAELILTGTALVIRNVRNQGKVDARIREIYRKIPSSVETGVVKPFELFFPISPSLRNVAVS